MSSYLFKRVSKFKFLNFVIVLLAIFSDVPVCAQKSSTKTRKNPTVEAMRLRGDVSCMKIYHNFWSTKFGERVDDEPLLKQVLYFDSGHRLVCLEEKGDFITKAKYEAGNDTSYKIYVYEYEYDADGNLTTIDCYECGYKFLNYDLEWKMRLIPEDGVIVAHKYNGNGNEMDRLKPYNVATGIEGSHFHVESDEYVFAFEMIPKNGPNSFVDEKNKSKVNANYYWQYNSDNQLVKLSKGLDSSFLKANFGYDDKGNLAVIDFYYDVDGDASGEKWTVEYTYGDFEESAKRSYEGRMEEKKRKEELERSRRDSINAAKAAEKEYQRIRQDSIAKAFEKEAELQRIMRDSIQKVKEKEYLEKQKKEQKKERKDKIRKQINNFFKKQAMGVCRQEVFDKKGFYRKEVTCLTPKCLKGNRRIEYYKFSSLLDGFIFFRVGVQ